MDKDRDFSQHFKGRKNNIFSINFITLSAYKDTVKLEERIFLEWLIYKSEYFCIKRKSLFFYSSKRDISQKTGIGVRRVMTLIKKFEERGLIKTTLGGVNNSRKFYPQFESFKYVAFMEQFYKKTALVDEIKAYYRDFSKRGIAISKSIEKAQKQLSILNSNKLIDRYTYETKDMVQSIEQLYNNLRVTLKNKKGGSLFGDERTTITATKVIYNAVQELLKLYGQKTVYNTVRAFLNAYSKALEAKLNKDYDNSRIIIGTVTFDLPQRPFNFLFSKSDEEYKIFNTFKEYYERAYHYS